jgi:ParB-like chromosome segregation protein Spo0J
MEILTVNIEDIKPYEDNAKEHPIEQIEQIKKSILDYGNNDPIAVDENNIIIEGHGRYIAMSELGCDTVEIIRLEHLTEEQKKAYRLVHNKLTMNSDFDFTLLEKELSELDAFDMEAFGFDELQEYEHIFDLLEDDTSMSLQNSDDKSTFNITFTFPTEKEETIKNYIKDVGKDGLVEEIIMHIEKGAAV